MKKRERKYILHRFWKEIWVTVNLIIRYSKKSWPRKQVGNLETGLNVRFTTISNHFFTNYMNIFHKTERVGKQPFISLKFWESPSIKNFDDPTTKYWSFWKITHKLCLHQNKNRIWVFEFILFAWLVLKLLVLETKTGVISSSFSNWKIWIQFWVWLSRDLCTFSRILLHSK